MLLVNYIPEVGLMNGSVGTVIDICSPNSDRSNSDDHSNYVIVHFENCTIPEDQKLIPGLPSMYVPIPVHKSTCDNHCCTMHSIPLRVCKAITIHKSQGITIGENQMFKYAVVHFPEAPQPDSPIQALVAFTRAMPPHNFAIGNANITQKELKKIGKGPGEVKRRVFEE